MVERRLFGTDGIRGVANRAPMTAETCLALGRAIAYRMSRGRHRAKIVIGKDTRLSGYMFETALASGICSMGADVLLCGPLPTPAIAYITTGMRADAGVVISASHNPFQDNGIKIFGADGFKLPDEEEVELERLVLDGPDRLPRPLANRVGKASRVDDAAGRYVTFLKARLPIDLTLEGIRIVVDCAHGAAYRAAPLVFAELGASVHSLAVNPDGRNINRKCGALHPEAMAAAVKRTGAQLGIALDGDADRVIFADERGQIVDGDAIIAICAKQMIAERRLSKRTVVATVMSNIGLEKALEAEGGRLLRTPVGDRYVVEAMRRGGYSLGGEQSGHLIFIDHAKTGDGCIAALEILATMLRTGRTLGELKGVLRRWPQVLLNFEVRARPPLQSLSRAARAVRSVERALGRDGRVLVRYSGTEPKVRVMVEGPEQAAVARYAERIAEAIRQEIGVPGGGAAAAGGSAGARARPRGARR